MSYTLENRHFVSKVIVALMFVGSVCLLVDIPGRDGAMLGFSLRVPGVGAVIFALMSYLIAASKLSERIVAGVLAAGLQTFSVLIILAQNGEYSSQYSIFVSLAIALAYRNRMIMAIAAITAIVEQALFGVAFFESMFPLSLEHPHYWMLVHNIWVIIAAIVLLLLSEGAKEALDTEDSSPEPALVEPVLAESVSEPLAIAEGPAEVPAMESQKTEPVNEVEAPAPEAPREVPLTPQELAAAHRLKSSSQKLAAMSGARDAISGGHGEATASPESPAEAAGSSGTFTSVTEGSAAESTVVVAAGAVSQKSLEDLLKVASEVGTRAQKLSKTISNIEGPLKRMAQSINGANRGMLEIKDELSKTAASVIRITQSSSMHADKANDVFKAADVAAAGSQIGAQSTEESIRNMDRIREQMDSIADRMDNLLNKSQMMVKVVGFADELALQSKVLSVNAAIEAAKAGDRGQGFSAVAREVKSLANQSKEATRQVRQILKEIQKSIAEVRLSIASGNETVDLASEQCRSTAVSIKGLDSSVTSSRDAAEAIMNSSKDQVAGIMQISQLMNDIQTVSDQNSSSLGNLQVEAQKLNTITKDLASEMAGYQGLIEKLLTQCASLSDKKSGS